MSKTAMLTCLAPRLQGLEPGPAGPLPRLIQQVSPSFCTWQLGLEKVKRKTARFLRPPPRSRTASLPLHSLSPNKIQADPRAETPLLVGRGSKVTL